MAATSLPDGPGRRVPFLAMRLVGGVVRGVVAVVIAAVAGSAAAVVGGVVPAVAAPDDDGLRFEASSRYELRPDEHAVVVTVDMAFTNQVPDEGNTYYYFTGVDLPLPAEASDVEATSGDSSVSTDVDDTEVEEWDLASIDFPSNLRYGQEREIRLTYRLEDSQPRSGGRTKAHPAYASFDAFPVGDPGLADVTVVVPDDYQVETQGDEVRTSYDDRDMVLTATDVAEPDVWWLSVVARDDDALEQRDITFGEHAAVLHGWPGDDAWLDFVEDQVTSGVPALETVFGAPWPIRELQFVESASPHLYGYGGWFDEAYSTIEIGDDLDQELILHELAHAWSNSSLTADTWLLEGLAEYHAQQAIAELGGTPTEPVTPDPGAAAAIPLASWEHVAAVVDEQGHAAETYGYDTSYWVLDRLSDEVGPEAFRAVVSAAIAHEIPYVGDTEPTDYGGNLTWRRLLDLLEERAAATDAQQLLVDYVVAPDEGGRAGRPRGPGRRPVGVCRADRRRRRLDAAVRRADGPDRLGLRRRRRVHGPRGGGARHPRHGPGPARSARRRHPGRLRGGLRAGARVRGARGGGDPVRGDGLRPRRRCRRRVRRAGRVAHRRPPRLRPRRHGAGGTDGPGGRRPRRGRCGDRGGRGRGRRGRTARRRPVRDARGDAVGWLPRVGAAVPPDRFWRMADRPRVLQPFDHLTGLPDELDVHVWDAEPSLPPADVLDDVELYVLPYTFEPVTREIVGRMPRLRVVQTLTAGYEHVVPFLRDGIALCNARGVHDASTAELTVALTLAALRDVPRFVRSQDRQEWAYGFYPALADKTVLIVGYGSVGKAIEARLAGFECDVLRVARTARDGVAGIDALPELVGRADVVILILPLTDETRQLVDADLLSRMRDGALLVNVARGGIVDTDALVAELATGRIHAALDVTDPEPLPPGHPLWTAPNVLISPHVGGASSAFEPRARRLVLQQLARFAAGDPLANQVEYRT